MLIQNAQAGHRALLLVPAIMLTTMHFGLAKEPSGSAVEDCMHVPLSEIFDSPYKFDGKLICTRGYYDNKGIPVLHTSKSPPREKYYLYAMLLDINDDALYEKLLELRPDSLLTVKGILTVPAICWCPESADDEVGVCAPFTKPIDLQVTELIK